MQFLHEGQWVDVPEHIVDLIRRDERAKARQRVEALRGRTAEPWGEFIYREVLPALNAADAAGGGAMSEYFKAIRPDGGSFHDPSFKWATEVGGVTTHPSFTGGGDASGYLSVSTVATDCTGFSWPCRLLVVEPVGDVFTPDVKQLPNKRAGGAFRTVEERPPWEVFGPNGQAVVAVIERTKTLTGDEARRLDAARDAVLAVARDAAWAAAWAAVRDAAWAVACDAVLAAARDAALAAARDAALAAARDAVRDAARTVARDAVLAVLTRDLITDEQYRTLIGPWESVIGAIDGLVKP